MNRKLILAAAAASALLLSSCRKADEVTSTDVQLDELEFTATIDGPSTKTTVNTDKYSDDRGKIEWEKGDSILITDANNTSVVYVTEEGDGTFRKKAGQTGRLAYGSQYSATYGTKPSKSQKYADYYGGVNQAKNVYMTTGTPIANRSLKFTAACGLLKLTLTAADGADESIKKIEVSGTVNGTDAIYILDCVDAKGNGVSISSATDFYLTLPAGTYTKMVFTNDSDATTEYSKSGSSEMTIENNKIQPVTIKDVTFIKPDPVFSVSASKKVQFTKGNLWYGTKKLDGTAVSKGWHLESSQTSYPTSWSTEHVGHFFWSRTPSVAYDEAYSDGSASGADKFFCGADNPLTVDGQEGLYALSKDEWCYLIYSRGSGLYQYGVTVSNGGKDYKNCLIIAPDWYTGKIATSYDAAAWAKAEESGLVCLPAAGYRYGSGLGNGGSLGYYWSATPGGYDENYAYFLFFRDSYVDPSFSNPRYYGYSVRLVSTVK